MHKIFKCPFDHNNRIKNKKISCTFLMDHTTTLTNNNSNRLNKQA